MSPAPKRTHGTRPRPAPRTAPEEMTRGEYATLVMLVAGTLIATAFFLGWLLEQREKPPTGSHTTNVDDGSFPAA